MLLIRIALVVATLPMLVIASVALGQGTPSLNELQNSWKQMDLCARQAALRFPEWDAESVRKRDHYAKQCQQQSKVPTRSGAAASGSTASPPTK